MSEPLTLLLCAQLLLGASHILPHFLCNLLVYNCVCTEPAFPVNLHDSGPLFGSVEQTHGGGVSCGLTEAGPCLWIHHLSITEATCKVW